MKFSSDKKPSLPYDKYDKKPIKGNTLDYYNDDMSRKAVGKLFDDSSDGLSDQVDDRMAAKVNDAVDASETADYIDLDEVDTYIQKKHVNISSVFEDTTGDNYDISMYQSKKKDAAAKAASAPAKSAARGGAGAYPPSKSPSSGKAAPTKPGGLKRPFQNLGLDDGASDTNARSMLTAPREINSQMKVAALVIVIVFLSILAALIYRMNVLNSELKSAKEIVSKYNPDAERELSEYVIWYDSLQMENERLQRELDAVQTNTSQPSPTSSPLPGQSTGGQNNNQSPTSSPQTSAQGDKLYTVIAGDNLYNIALKHYNSGAEEYINLIKQANGLTDSNIHPGDVLTIPAR